MRKLLRIFIATLCLFGPCHYVVAQDETFDENGEYRRAVDDKDNVKEKLFTKKGTVELNLLDFGWILNTAFVSTYLVHGGLTYYPNEAWGFGIEGSMGLNQDKDERKCLETFYNKGPNGGIPECGDGSELDNSTSNYGPAYMPIREIKYILAGNAVWNPIYGKQLLLLSSTSYFDVFLTMGGGLVMSDYYEQRTTLRNGKKARAEYNESSTDPNSPECQAKKQRGESCDAIEGGAKTSETDSYGEAGRPDPIAQTNPFINLGLGQRYHFWKRFNVKFEFRDMLLLGTPGGFENYFAIWAGVGVRF